MERVKEDSPITIKDDKDNLNHCIADVVSLFISHRQTAPRDPCHGRDPAPPVGADGDHALHEPPVPRFRGPPISRWPETLSDMSTSDELDDSQV
ncbi:Vacuolar protein sorting-associated protein 28-like protein [Sciurus carolinensis]|uniref:Vacuolar protein sorting-associated protein 28-like protein n=1 Tax=Sciurus carolinensis TaxID=30640 RepID=A0AA41T9S2_SCICA|nr:Vacuolar protein sorting-associated protein 28-like protein [Sciurus carolinensis]